MKLSIEEVSRGGGFVGDAVKRTVDWKGETYDVYVLKLSYHNAVEDIQSEDRDLLAARRIARCIVDEDGKPIFTVADVIGVYEDGSPVMQDGKPRGPLSDELTIQLMALIGEVSELGKRLNPPI
jgi:hypothetical protein